MKQRTPEKGVSMKHLTPEGGLKKVQIMDLISEISHFSRESLLLFSAVEALQISKEVQLFLLSYFDSSAAPMDVQAVNPTIIVGETNVSSDKTVAGTVTSQRYFTQKPRLLPPHIVEEIKGIVESWYQEASDLQNVIKLDVTQGEKQALLQELRMRKVIKMNSTQLERAKENARNRSSILQKPFNGAKGVTSGQSEKKHRKKAYKLRAVVNGKEEC